MINFLPGCAKDVCLLVEIKSVAGDENMTFPKDVEGDTSKNKLKMT